MLQLDKLEHEIGVDACAEVIQKRAPAPTQRIRNNNFVFTIKIIEAEDLKACDINGLSDPYVVLGDEYQKRLAKTRVIYGNLNPRWDETIDITTNGPLNIVATIWDWDALGDHDCVGFAFSRLHAARVLAGSRHPRSVIAACEHGRRARRHSVLLRQVVQNT
jgi:hypothetical protein